MPAATARAATSATTVAKGLAVPEMCHTYNLRNKQEYIETLRQTNKKLSETKKALKESEEQAMREKDAAQDASETMNSMLNKLPNGVVIVDNELKILHSNERFLEIIGEDARAIAEIIPGLQGCRSQDPAPLQCVQYILLCPPAKMSRS